MPSVSLEVHTCGREEWRALPLWKSTHRLFRASPARPVCLCSPVSLSIALRTVTYRHIYERGHTQSRVCVRACGLIKRCPTLCRRLWLIGWSWREKWPKKKKKKRGGTRLSWNKQNKKKPKKAKYYFALVFTLEDDIYILFVVSTKQIGPVTWCNIKAINLYPGCLKQRPGHFVIMKKKKKKEKKLPAVISWLLKLPVGRW